MGGGEKGAITEVISGGKASQADKNTNKEQTEVVSAVHQASVPIKLSTL